jgi:hypothetical protein
MWRINKAMRLLTPLFQNLAQYYYICTEGGLIGRDNWNEERYGTLVGQDHIAVQYACILRDLWLDTGNSGTNWLS